MNRINTVLVSLVLVTLLGCGEKKDDKPSLNKPGVAVISLRESAADLVVAEVGVKKITCGDLRQRLEFERELFKFRKGKMGENELAQRLNGFTKQRIRQVLPELVRQKMTEIQSEEAGVSLTKEERDTEVARQLKAIRVSDLNKFATTLGCTPEYAERQICSIRLLKKLVEVREPEIKTVTDREVDDGLKRLDDYYARAIASNAVTWVTCSNVVKQLEQGLDFVQAGAKYGYENGGEAERWGSFAQDDLEDSALRTWAFTAPTGALKIFELDDGISIVKVTDVSNRTNEMNEVELARINFAMVEPEPEPRTREYVHSALLKWKADEARKRLLDDVQKRHPVRFLYPKTTMTY